MSGKWWLLRAGGAGELGEAAEGHGAAGKVHLSRTRQKKWAKIGPLSPFSSCPRISQSGQGARAALWAALWPDSGRPSAGPGLPFGPPLVLRAGLAALRAALRAAPLPRPFFEGRPERRPFFCKGRPHFEGGRPVGGPSAMVAARSETAGRPSGRPILEGGRPLFSGGPPELGQRAAPFGGWAAPVAAGRPAHQLGPIRPLTAHRLSGSYA